MFAFMAATALDRTAAVLVRVAGDTGDRIAGCLLAPIRARINVNCTNCPRGTCAHRF
jgi:hypothetical protein